MQLGQLVGWADLNLCAALQQGILRPFLRRPLSWTPWSEITTHEHRLGPFDFVVVDRFGTGNMLEIDPSVAPAGDVHVQDQEITASGAVARPAASAVAGRVRIRPNPLRVRDTYFVYASPVVITVAAAADPRRGSWWAVVLLYVLSTAIVAAEHFWFFLEVGDSEVTCNTTRGFKRRSIERSELRTIAVDSFGVLFLGDDRQVICRSRPYWSRPQLAAVAKELGVALEDQRRWRGGRKVRRSW